jgi:hypothetical protein
LMMEVVLLESLGVQILAHWIFIRRLIPSMLHLRAYSVCTVVPILQQWTLIPWLTPTTLAATSICALLEVWCVRQAQSVATTEMGRTHVYAAQVS